MKEIILLGGFADGQRKKISDFLLNELIKIGYIEIAEIPEFDFTSVEPEDLCTAVPLPESKRYFYEKGLIFICEEEQTL